MAYMPFPSTGPLDANVTGTAFDGILPVSLLAAALDSSSSSVPYHVFISLRWLDVNRTLVIDIYERLKRMGLRVFLDKEELGFGASIPREIQDAIHSALVHIVIFSPRYAESPWCLEELSIRTPRKITPVFYYVDSSDFRLVVHGKGVYAHAFSNHEERRRYSREKLEDWKTALSYVSFLEPLRLKNKEEEEKFVDRLVKLVVTDLLKTFNKTPSAQSFWVCVHYIRGVTDMVSAFNLGVIVLTIGNYGLQLSAPVFWLCWSSVIVSLIQPYWKSIKSAMPARTAYASEDSEKLNRPSGRAEAVFLKVGMSLAVIAMLIILEDLSQRQNKILLFVGLSSILIEGFQALFIVKEEFQSFIGNLLKAMQMIQSIAPSVINAMIIVTGEIVLGGNLGSLMRQKPFWIFVSIVVVDLIAEAIHRFDCGNRCDSIPERKARWYYISIVLRLIVGGSLCCWMTKEILQNSNFLNKEILQNSNFSSQVNATIVCDLKCQERSKSLLITMVVLGGLQAAVSPILVIGYLFSYIYKFLRPPTSASQSILPM